MTRLKMFAAVWGCVWVLAGCGGGGGGGDDETLNVSVSYAAGGQAHLLQTTRIQPAMSGFAGHTPNCSLVSGDVPPGMVLNSDCSVSGTPQTGGAFSFVVRVGANGVKNTIDVSGGVYVRAPSLQYAFSISRVAGWGVGTSASEAPINGVFWQPGAGVTTLYHVASGSLPPGMTIAPDSGVISGTPTGISSGPFRIGVTVSANGRSVTLLQENDILGSSGLTTGAYPLRAEAMLGEMFELVPKLVPPAGSVLAFSVSNETTPGLALPEGLVLNVATGTISGIPTRSMSQQKYIVRVHLTTAGVTTHQDYPLHVQTKSTMTVDYNWRFASVGRAFWWLPSIYDTNSTSATYRYAVNTSAPWPPGLTLDPISGKLEGTLGAPFDAEFFVDVTVTIPSGRSFVLTARADLEAR